MLQDFLDFALLVLFRRIFHRRLLVPVTFLACLIFANPCHAVQSHGGLEGLVSHQLGHIVFTIGMLVLLQQIHSHRLRAQGWQTFQVFLWLIIAWNILTFSGHWIGERLDGVKLSAAIVQSGGFHIQSLADLIFYLSRLDHLLLLPAFIVLLVALRQWIRASSEVL